MQRLFYNKNQFLDSWNIINCYIFISIIIAQHKLMFWYWLSNFNTNRHRNKIHSGWLNSGFCIVVVACLKMGLEWDGNFIFCLSCSNLANSLRSWMVVNAFHNSIVTKPTATIIAMTPNATPIKSGPFGHTRSTISPSAFVKRWSITNSGPRSNAENQLKKLP